MIKKLTLVIVLIFFLISVIGCSTNRDVEIDYEIIGESQHFIIYSDVPEEDGAYYSRTLEAMYDYINNNFFSVRNAEKLNIVLLFKKSNEVSNNSTTARLPSEGPLYGYYYDGVATIDMNLGMGTISHEVIHHFTSAYKTNLSMFASEGIATYFEKFVGYTNENEGSKISFGYLHPRRIINASKRLNDVTLSDVITSQKHADNDLSYSVMLFMQRQGLLKGFVNKRLTTNQSDIHIIESLFAKPISKIDTEWKSWLLRQLNYQDLELVKLAFMHKSTAEFHSWIKQNRLVWDESLMMYKIAD